MKIQELIDNATRLLSLVAAKSSKHAPEAENLKLELAKLKGWAYPELSTEDIVRVVRCAKCKYYKQYKKKGDPKAAPFYACSLNMLKRAADFYCGEGKEK